MEIHSHRRLVCNVYYEGLANQLQRKGFDLLGVIGDGITKRKCYTMWGEKEKITPREKPFVEFAGKLHKGKGYRHYLK